MAGAVRRQHDPVRWRTPAVVAASIAIHAALLGPLALRGLGLADPSWPDIPEPPFFIPVDIEPRPVLPGEVPRAGLPPGRTETLLQDRTLPRPAEAVAAPSTDVPMEDEKDETTPIVPDPAPATAAPTTAPTPGPAIDGWAVATPPGMARGFGPGGRLDCRDLIALNAMDRAACERRFENAAARAQAARIGERRLTRTESVREDGFAEQAAANEAWRDYRRSPDAPYPGLRSMLKHF